MVSTTSCKLLAAAGLIAASCVPAPAGPRPDPAVRVTHSTPARFDLELRVRWRRVHAAMQCEFHSGPEGLGDRVVVQRRGEALLMTLGDARFHGGIDGRAVWAQRVSRVHRPKRWDVTERIEGALDGHHLTGIYTYEACDPTGVGGCPSRCRIRAAFETVEVAPRSI